jgi:hypothetical protein
MDKHKLGIIVPYRNREEQLQQFIISISNFLNTKNLDYEIIIVEQDNAKQFNRGMLLNIGFTYSEKLKCDYVVFHDVDMLPVDVDYSFSPIPLHLATNFILEDGEKNREVFDEYFGGVTMFPSETFMKINGYSNKYWGWGYEDSDLLFRCKIHNIETDLKKYKNQGKNGHALRFNGINSYVECENKINTNNNATFLITFYPDEFILDHTKQSDEFTVFSIPGWDLAISYTSFSRYNFCLFDSNKNPFFINTEIKHRYKTVIVVVIDRNDNIIKLYQDGLYIGETSGFKSLHPYRKEKKFYLGAGNPNREIIPNFFKGTISNFAYFDTILNENEIYDISVNTENTLIKNFNNYTSSDSLKIYYDSDHIENYKMVNLVGSENGEIVNCEIIDETYDEYVECKIPFRRLSYFKSLKHDENGYDGKGWKDQATRWNQLRFHNEVSLNPELMMTDGLSDLKFHEYGKIYKNNVLYVNVGI